MKRYNDSGYYNNYNYIEELSYKQRRSDVHPNNPNNPNNPTKSQYLGKQIYPHPKINTLPLKICYFSFFNMYLKMKQGPELFTFLMFLARHRKYSLFFTMSVNGHENINAQCYSVSVFYHAIYHIGTWKNCTIETRHIDENRLVIE